MRKLTPPADCRLDQNDEHQSRRQRSALQFAAVLYRERDEQQGLPCAIYCGSLPSRRHSLFRRPVTVGRFLHRDLRAWVIPYIGDLVSNNLLNNAQDPHASDTANSLFPDLFGPSLDPTNCNSYSRRCSPHDLLPPAQRHAADARRNGARRLPAGPRMPSSSFELLIWNQNLNHLRMFSNGLRRSAQP